MSFVYKCDCIYVQEEKIRKNWYKYRHKTREFVKVDLNKEGNCIHCGHSVVAFPKYIYPKVQQAGGYFKMACRAVFTKKGFSREEFEDLQCNLSHGSKDWFDLNRRRR